MLKPIEDRVVVKPIVEDISTTASGFLISKADEKPQEAIVVAVGPTGVVGAWNHAEVVEGDSVLRPKGVTNHPIWGNRLLLCALPSRCNTRRANGVLTIGF